MLLWVVWEGQWAGEKGQRQDRKDFVEGYDGGLTR